jgi:hypothetical protein
MPHETSTDRAILMPYGPTAELAKIACLTGEPPQMMGGLGVKVEKWIGAWCEK